MWVSLGFILPVLLFPHVLLFSIWDKLKTGLLKSQSTQTAWQVLFFTVAVNNSRAASVWLK